MEGLAAILAKQKFCDAIESLRVGDSRAAWDGMNEALSGGLADAACGLILLRTLAAQKNEYDEILRELQANLTRLAEMPTTLEVSAYGYYALARCYALLGIRREKFLSNFVRTTLRMKMNFKSELMNIASSLYLQCIARDTAFAEAVFELGLVYDIGLNSRDNAIEAYEIVTRLNPDHTLARGNLAHLYNETKQLEEAQEEAEHLVRLSPNAVSYNKLSDIYARQKMTKEAWLAARAAMQLPEQRGILEVFSGQKFLLSPETVASVPSQRAPQPMFQPRPISEAHFTH
ncbi:MAG: tetratricopeptide repeat protein [Terracidiphilus sp.]|jgi:tetratricopeptide (TPR) repeat protein